MHAKVQFKKEINKNRGRQILNEYGVRAKKQKSSRKELKTKSQSQKHILIAKNRTLEEFFNVPTKTINVQSKCPVINKKQSQSQKIVLTKDNLANSIKGLAHVVMNNLGEKCIQNQRNQNFWQAQSKKQNFTDTVKPNYSVKKSSQQIGPRSFRNEANQIQSRLKKSDSMRNLIQQRFAASEQDQKEKAEYGLRPNEYYNRQIQIKSNLSDAYDSSKYNWRLSRSKQKQSLKSLSFAKSSSKSKINPPTIKFQQQKPNKKLSLSAAIQGQTLNRRKDHLFQIKACKNQTNLVQASNQPEYETLQSDDKLAYTFGSDF